MLSTQQRLEKLWREHCNKFKNKIETSKGANDLLPAPPLLLPRRRLEQYKKM